MAYEIYDTPTGLERYDRGPSALGAATDRFQGLNWEAAAAVASDLGAEKAKQFALKQAQDNFALANKYKTMGAQEIKDIESGGDLGDWARNTFVQNAPQMGTQVLAGAVGAVMGGPAGALTMASMASLPTHLGESSMRQREEGIDDPGKRWASSIGNTALDAIVPAMAGTKIARAFSKAGPMGRASIVGSAMKGATLEGATEGAQRISTDWSADISPDFQNKDYLWSIGNEVAAGGLLGGTMSGGAQALSSPRELAQNARMPELGSMYDNMKARTTEQVDKYGLMGKGASADPNWAGIRAQLQQGMIERGSRVWKTSDLFPNQLEFLASLDPQDAADMVNQDYGKQSQLDIDRETAAAVSRNSALPRTLTQEEQNLIADMGLDAQLQEGLDNNDARPHTTRTNEEGESETPDVYLGTQPPPSAIYTNKKASQKIDFRKEDMGKTLWQNNAQFKFEFGANPVKTTAQAEVDRLNTSGKNDFEVVPMGDLLERDAGISFADAQEIAKNAFLSRRAWGIKDKMAERIIAEGGTAESVTKNKKTKGKNGRLKNVPYKEYTNVNITHPYEFLNLFDSIKVQPRTLEAVEDQEVFDEEDLFGSPRRNGIVVDENKSNRASEQTTYDKGYMPTGMVVSRPDPDNKGEFIAVPQLIDMKKAVKIRKTQMGSGTTDRDATASVIAELGNNKKLQVDAAQVSRDPNTERMAARLQELVELQKQGVTEIEGASGHAVKLADAIENLNNKLDQMPNSARGVDTPAVKERWVGKQPYPVRADEVLVPNDVNEKTRVRMEALERRIEDLESREQTASVVRQTKHAYKQLERYTGKETSANALLANSQQNDMLGQNNISDAEQVMYENRFEEANEIAEEAALAAEAEAPNYWDDNWDENSELSGDENATLDGIDYNTWEEEFVQNAYDAAHEEAMNYSDTQMDVEGADPEMEMAFMGEETMDEPSANERISIEDPIPSSSGETEFTRLEPVYNRGKPDSSETLNEDNVEASPSVADIPNESEVPVNQTPRDSGTRTEVPLQAEEFIGPVGGGNNFNRTEAVEVPLVEPAPVDINDQTDTRTTTTTSKSKGQKESNEFDDWSLKELKDNLAAYQQDVYDAEGNITAESKEAEAMVVAIKAELKARANKPKPKKKKKAIKHADVASMSDAEIKTKIQSLHAFKNKNPAQLALLKRLNIEAKKRKSNPNRKPKPKPKPKPKSKKQVEQVTPSKVGFKLSPATNKKVKWIRIKDQKKADLANAYIGYGASGTDTNTYFKDATKNGIPTNKRIKADKNTVAFVSVNGDGRITEVAFRNTVNSAIDVLRAGGMVVMGSERRVQDALMELEDVHVQVVGQMNQYSLTPFAKPEPKPKPKTKTSEQENSIYSSWTLKELKTEREAYQDDVNNAGPEDTTNEEQIIKDIDAEFKRRGKPKFTRNESGTRKEGAQGTSINDTRTKYMKETENFTPQDYRNAIQNKETKLKRLKANKKTSPALIEAVQEELEYSKKQLEKMGEQTFQAVNEARAQRKADVVTDTPNIHEPEKTSSEESLDNYEQADIQNLAEKMLSGTGLKTIIMAPQAARDAAKKEGIADFDIGHKYGHIHGFTVKTPKVDGTFEVYINPNISKAAQKEILAHELGHATFFSAWVKTSRDEALSIEKSFDKWLKRHGKDTEALADLIKSKKSPKAAMLYLQNALHGQTLAGLPKESKAYLMDFEEWFADEAGKAFLSKTAPRTVVQKFFHKIMVKLKRIFGKDKLGAFIDGLKKSNPGNPPPNVRRKTVAFSKGLDSNPKTKSVLSTMANIVLDKDNRLRAMKIPAITELADLMYKTKGNTRRDNSYWSAKDINVARFDKKLNDIMENVSKEKHTSLLQELYGKPVSKEAKQIQSLFKDISEYMLDVGIKVSDHFPEMVNVDYLIGHQQEFVDMMKRNPKAMDTAAREHTRKTARVWLYSQHLPVTSSSIDSAIVSGDVPTTVASEMPMVLYNELVDTNGASLINSRKYDFMSPNDIVTWQDNYLHRSVMDATTMYINQAVKRTEFERRFGGQHGKYKESKLDILMQKAEEQGATAKQLEFAYDSVSAEIGTHGRRSAQWLHDKFGVAMPESYAPMNAKLQEIQGWMMTLSNVAVLGLSTITSLADPVGILARTGDLGMTLSAMKEGIVASLKHDQGEVKHLATTIGSISDTVIRDTFREGYSGTYMSKGAKRVNDWFFNFIQLERWTRTTRLMGTAAARDFIIRHDKRPNKNSKRFLKELGLQKGDLKYNKEGKLDLLSYDAYKNANAKERARDDRVKHAMSEFVDSAILRPTPSQRPLWGSDPHWALFFHLKSFMYSFHKTVLSRIGYEMTQSNYAPLMATAGYIPIMLMASMMKDMVKTLGDDDDDWTPDYKENWSTMDHLLDASEKGGLAGVLQPLLDIARERKYGGTGIMALPGPGLDIDTYTKLPLPLNYWFSNISK